MSDGEIPVASRFRPSARRVVEILNAHDVKYVMVGGAALQSHGVPHVTKDTDVVIASSAENRLPLGKALDALHATPQGSGELGQTFITSHGKLDVLDRTDGRGDYEAWEANAETVRLGEDGPLVRLGAMDDVRLDKTVIDRQKDRDALDAMDAFERGEVPPAELLMGPRPLEEPARERQWDLGAALLDRFRVKHDISSPEPLGRGEGGPEMEAEREKVLRFADRFAPGPEIDGPAVDPGIEPWSATR